MLERSAYYSRLPRHLVTVAPVASRGSVPVRPGQRRPRAGSLAYPCYEARTQRSLHAAKSAAFAEQRRWGEGLAEVKVQESESVESALRRFKRKVQQEDIIKDIKKHSYYLKPGDKRRAKQALARKRSRKKLRRESE